MHPAYTDTSHFRAPYLNVMLSGLGVLTNGDAEATPLTPGQIALQPFIDFKPDGQMKYNKATADLMLLKLQQFGAVQLSAEAANLRAYTVEELAAAAVDPASKATLAALSGRKWAEDKLANGMVVFLSITMLGGQQVIPGPLQIAAIDASEADRVAFTSKIMPILSEPSLLKRAGLLGGAGVVALAVVAGVVLLGKKKKRRPRRR